MILKGIIYWTLAFLVMAAVTLLTWNKAIIYLPIEGIVFKEMSFQTAANFSFWMLLIQTVGLGFTKLIVHLFSRSE